MMGWEWPTTKEIRDVIVADVTITARQLLEAGYCPAILICADEGKNKITATVLWPVYSSQELLDALASARKIIESGRMPTMETVKPGLGPDDHHINEFGWSTRTYNLLHNANIGTISDLVQKTEQDLLKIKHLGGKRLNEIKAVLESMGLSLAV